MATGSSRFRAIVNLDDQGEINCFCPYEEYLEGLCVCREQFNCPEAIIEVTVLPNSRPSDKGVSEIKKASRETKQAGRDLKKATDRIKQGVNRLEKVTRGNRWRI